MTNDLTEKQKINAELAARANNKKSLKVLKNHIPAEEQDGIKIAFQCECSEPTCSAKIPLTLREYNRLHDRFARFVVAKDHVEPTIEKVTKNDRDVQVVEKFALTES
jgi:hypothetical protein